MVRLLRRTNLGSSLFSPCHAKPRQCSRQLHRQVTASSIPEPTPFVPDSKTFLTLIGRNLIQHAAKLPTWNSLFSLTSEQLREVGVEPARTRRYLLWWRDRFKKGIYGLGGDLRHVKDGKATLKVVEIPYSEAELRPKVARTGLEPKKKIVIDLPPEVSIESVPMTNLVPIKGFKVRGAQTIIGQFTTKVKGTGGSVATFQIREGLWEEKRGVKIDGGERRRAEVRHKRRIEENKKRDR